MSYRSNDAFGVFVAALVMGVIFAYVAAAIVHQHGREERCLEQGGRWIEQTRTWDGGTCIRGDVIEVDP